MPRKRRKLTAAERAARKQRRAEFMPVFIGGRQKRVRRPLIDGLPADEFLRRNADPVWLLQNGYFELIEPAPAPANEATEPLVPPDAAEPENLGQAQSPAAHVATGVAPAPSDGELPF